MNSLYIRVDLAILPPNQFNFVNTLLEFHHSDQDKNSMLKCLISLGYFCLSQKEITMFSSNTVKKIQTDSKIFKFRIYDSPEFKLFNSISKKARRATINALLYTGVNSLKNLAFEYALINTSSERKQKIEELIFKAGLFKEFELILGKAFEVETYSIASSQQSNQILNKVNVNKDVLKEIPIPKLDSENIHEFASQTVSTVSESNIVRLETESFNNFNPVSAANITNNEAPPSIDKTVSIQSDPINLSDSNPSDPPAKKSRWKNMNIDCG